MVCCFSAPAMEVSSHALLSPQALAFPPIQDTLVLSALVTEASESTYAPP